MGFNLSRNKQSKIQDATLARIFTCATMNDRSTSSVHVINHVDMQHI